jgi:hypothetical protein
MRYAKLGALGTIAATLCCGSALAQQFFTPRAENNTYVSQVTRPPSGDVYFGLSEEYDSNVAESDAALAALHGLHQSDWIFTPSVRVNVVAPMGATTFYTGGVAAYDFYSVNHRLSRADIDVFAGASTRLLCQDSLTGDFQDQRQNDIISSAAGIVNSQATGGVTLHVGCGQKYGFDPSFSVGERWSTNSAEVFAPLDYRMFVANAALSYTRPVIGTIGLYGEFNDLTYDHDVFVGGRFQSNGYEDVTGGVTFMHTGTRLYVNASLGYNHLTPDVSGQPGFSGLSYALDARYSMGPRLQWNAGLTRAAVPSDLPFASFRVDSTYHGRVDFSASDQFRVGIGGQIEHDDYHGTPFLFNFQVGSQTVYQAIATADFWVNRHLDLGLSAREVWRDTDTPGFNYTATILMASITAKFGN